MGDSFKTKLAAFLAANLHHWPADVIAFGPMTTLNPCVGRPSLEPLIATAQDFITAQDDVDSSWNGEGIPPAGVECEAREVAYSHGQWRVLTVLYSSDDYLLAIDPVSGPKPRIYSTDSFLFRKIMTDEERRQLRKTKAVEEIAYVMTGNRENWGNYLTLAELIYESLESGKIPGIPALNKDQ